MLQNLRELSQKRKKILAPTLGVASAVELRQILGTDIDDVNKKKVRISSTKSEEEVQGTKDDSVFTDEIVYKDSSTFMKDTQSLNPHNDYCQHFIDRGQRPQNFIRDVGLADRFEEYPKLRELIKLKDDLISETATPPMHLKTDLASYNLKDLNCKFDVILHSRISTRGTSEDLWCYECPDFERRPDNGT